MPQEGHFICVFSSLPVETGPHAVTGSGLWPWTTGRGLTSGGFFQEPQTTVAPHVMGPGMQTHPLSFSVPFIVLNMWKQAAFMI